MKLNLIAFLLLNCLVSGVFAQSTVDVKSEEDQKLEAKAIMTGVYDSFLKIVPYVYSDANEGDVLKKNAAKKEELLKNLGDISEFFKSATHVQFFKRPGFRPSLETINSHLEDTINSVKNDNFNFAQKRLKAMTSLCISCHSQLSEASAKNAFGENVKRTTRESFDSDYAFANYLYLVRKFEDSEKYFALAIESSLEKSQEHVLLDSLRKELSMTTKVKFDFKKTESFLSKYLNDKRMPIVAKKMVEEWTISSKSFSQFNANKVKSIPVFIETYLKPLEDQKLETKETNHDIRLLIASGVLTKFVSENPKSKQVPEILYWLSVAENRLAHTYFFSLGDLYLKDCIKLYPQSPFARKCYNLYEENINVGYSGSAGTDIPDTEKRELLKLKGLLK
jgi:hypothetical protein